MASGAMLSLVASEGDASRRASQRYRTLLSARLVTTAGEYSVKVRNLSMTGAMIEGPGIPAQGSDVMLRRGALEIFAEVVWTNGERCGLCFAEPLSEGEVWSQLKATQTPPAPAPIPTQYRRPGFKKPAVLSEQERLMAGAWVNPPGRQPFGE